MLSQRRQAQEFSLHDSIYTKFRCMKTHVSTLLGSRIRVPHGGCGVEGVEGLERPGGSWEVVTLCFLLWVPATWINSVRSCETSSSSILLACALFAIYVSFNEKFI